MPDLGSGNDRQGVRNADGLSAPVHVAAAACLSLQRPGQPCDLCATACPTAAITIGERSLQIAGQACIGCGHCQAVCPTEAVEVDGFSLRASSSVRIECSRVPKSERASSDVTVPCLGGLNRHELRRLLSSPESRITIVDRGWCATCRIGGGAAPWASVVARLARDLEVVECGPGRLRVAHEPLPAAKAEPPPAAPGAQGRPQLSRRGLFAAVSQPKMLRPPQAVQLRQDGVVPERVDATALGRRRGWLEAMSVAAELPAAHFPAARIADTCCSNQVCVRSCPTGALHPITDTEHIGVSFDAPLCIACGACESACPTKSISIAPEGSGVYGGPVTLREVRRATCSRCDAVFTPQSADESVCLACGKDLDLSRLVHGLFKTRATV
jgi:Fe-S-cluster-containing hydrogenase component 2